MDEAIEILEQRIAILTKRKDQEKDRFEYYRGALNELYNLRQMLTQE